MIFIMFYCFKMVLFCCNQIKDKKVFYLMGYDRFNTRQL